MTPSAKMCGRFAATLGICAALTSCASYRLVKPDDTVLTSGSDSVRGLRLDGYTTTDFYFHPFDGYVHARGDSLVFERAAARGKGLAADSPDQVVAVPRDQILSVKLRTGLSSPKTVGFVIVMAALVGVWIVLGNVGNW